MKTVLTARTGTSGTSTLASSNKKRVLRRAVSQVLESLEQRRLLTAVVTTDQEDYVPGSVAQIIATNDANVGSNFDFTAGETVEFQVRRTDGQPDFPQGNQPWRVIDGNMAAAHLDANNVWVYPDLDGVADGAIHTSWDVEYQYGGATLELSATGLDSGAHATAHFTDANVKAVMQSTFVGTDSATLNW